MRVVRPILMALGVVMALMGLLWIGQGLGYVMWPASGFMLQQRVWADYGAGLAVVGMLLILVSRRLPRR